MSRLKLIALMLGALALAVSACGGSPAAPTALPPTTVPAAPAATDSQPAATALPVDTAAPVATDSQSAATVPAASGGQIVLQLAPSGNEARYRVREQLANVSLPSDAVGKTSAVTGQIVIGADGAPVSGQSKIVVDITGLTSDRGMRDGFVQRNVLEGATYPTVEFVPTGVSGLPSPLPASGDVTFKLTGDLTVHGATKTVTWDVTAKAANGADLTGTAVTSFTFADFGLQQPRVPLVLSIQDTIKLEFDFHFVKAG